MDKKILSRMIFGAALLLFAACTNDELTDGTDALPEGKYPLQIASVTMEAESSAQPWGAKSPQTRVSENENGMSSKFDWDGTEQIGVQLYADGDVATYTLNAGQTLTPDKTLYWKSTATKTVTAWYPTATTVSLDNQSDKLAYVLKGSGEGNYSTAVRLRFIHALAKVRVALQGDQADKVADVKIKSLTSCTHTQGTVSGSGATEGWIRMMPVTYDDVKYYEANVVPGHTITEFQVNGKEDRLNDGGITPLVAKVNTITLTVNKAATEITGGATITEAGDYIVTGNVTETITLNGEGINLTLDNVTTNISNAIKVTGGNPTLIVKGTGNSFSGDGAGILISSGASVTVQGATTSPADSKLTISANSSSQPGIGSPDENTCGNIIIENVTLDVTGGNGFAGGAAIGTSGNWGSGCGNIEITNSIINATGGQGAAAIGMGFNCDCGYSIGAITITNSQLTIKTQSNGTTRGAGIGLGGNPDHSASTGYQVCGKITITTTESQEVFFGRFDTGDGFKAGKTSNSTYWSLQQWSGITFNSNSLASGSDNGYK